MGLFASQGLKDLQAKVEGGLAGFMKVSIGAMTDPEYLSYVVWGQWLPEAQEHARRCVVEDSEAKVRRLLRSMENAWMPNIALPLHAETRRWVTDVHPAVFQADGERAMGSAFAARTDVQAYLANTGRERPIVEMNPDLSFFDTMPTEEEVLAVIVARIEHPPHMSNQALPGFIVITNSRLFFSSMPPDEAFVFLAWPGGLRSAHFRTGDGRAYARFEIGSGDHVLAGALTKLIVGDGHSEPIEFWIGLERDKYAFNRHRAAIERFLIIVPS